MIVRSFNQRCTSLILLASALCVFAPAQAQQSTEQFIPIGYSPGISGNTSYIGKIVAMDRTEGTISVDDRGTMRVISVSESTRIWLDRSKVKRENRIGAYADCEVGRRIEVKYQDDDRRVADWIKIESG